MGGAVGEPIGQSVGLSGLSSGALRYRYYAHWGMTTEDVAKIVLLSGVTVGIGMAVLSGIVMVLNPGDAASVLHLSEATIMAIGIAIAATLLVIGIRKFRATERQFADQI